MNRKQYILEKVEKNTDLLGFKGKDIDKIQSYIDFFGLIPGVGDIADIVSAAVDVAQGQYGDAGILSLVLRQVSPIKSLEQDWDLLQWLLPLLPVCIRD